MRALRRDERMLTIQQAAARNSTSIPTARTGCGMRATMLVTKIRINLAIVAPAREGRCGNCRMRARFTDTATMTSPARAAAALAPAMKKLLHISGLVYAYCSLIIVPAYAFVPPSTVKFAPVMYEASGLATNATKAATSSTEP